MWILTNRGEKMKQSRLRKCAGFKLADLNPIHIELAKEGQGRIPCDMMSFTLQPKAPAATAHFL